MKRPLPFTAAACMAAVLLAGPRPGLFNAELDRAWLQQRHALQRVVDKEFDPRTFLALDGPGRTAWQQRRLVRARQILGEAGTV